MFKYLRNLTWLVQKDKAWSCERLTSQPPQVVEILGIPTSTSWLWAFDGWLCPSMYGLVFLRSGHQEQQLHGMCLFSRKTGNTFTSLLLSVGLQRFFLGFRPQSNVF